MIDPEAREWIASLPSVVHDLVVAWPPGSKVTRAETATCMIPGEGVVGTVVSYFEDGTLGVVAPMAASVTSPHTGITMSRGADVKAQCRPAQLELLEHSEITPDDVRAALSTEEAM